MVAVSPALQYADHNVAGGLGTTAIKGNGRKMQNTTLQGITPAEKDVNDLNIYSGRFFNESDEERAANVTVLGYDTADELFGVDDAPGKEVIVGGMLFTVVGVADKQKQAFGGGKNPADNVADFPITTFHKLHPEVLDYWITLKYDDPKNRPLVEDELQELLRRRRKVKNEAPDNFAIFGTDTLTRLWNNVSGGLFLLLFALSSVALLVGGGGGDEHHAGERDGADAGDRDSEGDWGDEADDSDAVYPGGDYAVRGGWGAGGGDRELDGVWAEVHAVRVADLAACGLLRRLGVRV